MAATDFTAVCIILTFFQTINCNPVRLAVHVTYPEIKENFTSMSHLKFEKIKRICLNENRIVICKSNSTRICAMRVIDGEIDLKNYENACFLFLSNMCDNPGKEYNIVSSVSCFNYTFTRRMVDDEMLKNDLSTASETVDTDTSTPPILRQAKTTKDTFSTIYDVDTSYDYHICPLSCPDTYSPVCVSVNRGHGIHFKMYTFVNHCLSDIYYCKHWQEFQPPPGDDSEMVNSSPLSWSFCAASRYIQFARFTEVASSMGHYGWLAGDFKASHILEGYERIPGFGK